MRHVIITGGSSGIGEAFARLHLSRGSYVTLIARDGERLSGARNRLAASAKGSHDRITLHSADVSDRTAVARAIAGSEASSGPCDLLITSAGIVMPGAFTSLDDSEFERQMAVNYLGTVHAVRAVFPTMQARRAGSILMISSGAGLIGLYGYSAYSPSKFALSGFAEALRPEASLAGIRIAICFPPDTDTPQLREEMKYKPEETKMLTRKAGLWSADAIAAHATGKMERGRFAIYPGFQIGALGRFGGMAKPLIDKWFDHRLRRMAAKRRNKDNPG